MAEQSEPAVQITLGEIYAEVRATRDDVREIREKIQPLTTGQADHEARLRTVEKNQIDGKDMESRVRSLEKARWAWAGLSGLFGGAIVEVIRVVGKG